MSLLEMEKARWEDTRPPYAQAKRRRAWADLLRMLRAAAADLGVKL